jgi:hypothetical protein
VKHRILLTLVSAITLSVSLTVARGVAAQTGGSNQTAGIYDNFNGQWIDPSRWLTGAPSCWGLSLECVREIQDGQLRLLVRNLGWNGGNSGTQWSQSDLYFPAANNITSITADVTVRQAKGTDCVLNPEKNGAQVRIGGTFFNSGSGDPGDDLQAYVIAVHGDDVLGYGLWCGWETQSQWVPITFIPMGTPVTTTLRWDRANHQFIATLTTPGGLYFQQASGYSIPDIKLAANPLKGLGAATISPNCAGQNTSSYVEASFDNVKVIR